MEWSSRSNELIEQDVRRRFIEGLRLATLWRMMWSRPERENIRWALDGGVENAACAKDEDSGALDLVLNDEKYGWKWSMPKREAAAVQWWLACDERGAMAGLCAVRMVHGALWQLGMELGVACDFDESMTSAIARELDAVKDAPALSDSLHALDLQRRIGDVMMDATMGPLFWGATEQGPGRSEPDATVETADVFARVGDMLRDPEGWSGEWGRRWRDLVHGQLPKLRDQGWMDAITADVRSAGELLWLQRTGRDTPDDGDRP